MRDLRPTTIWVTLGEKEYPMIFNLNTVDEIQTRFDKPLADILSDMVDDKAVYHTLKAILCILINEGIAVEQDNGQMMDEKPKTEKWIGRQISPSFSALSELQSRIFEAFDCSMPEPEDDNPDPQTEQPSM